MTGCSSKSISSSSTSIVRKYTDSVVIGSQQQIMRQKQQPCLLSSEPVHRPAVRDPDAQQHAQQLLKPRVISCSFEMEIPTNALRIDMSILVSTNDSSSSRTTSLLPRPSVTYKITICTPRRQEEEVAAAAAVAVAVAAKEEQRTTTTTTTTTFRYSSKFTVAKDLDANVVPYHEWNGSFALGEKKNTPLPLEDCSFHQVQGIFTANYDDNDDTKKKGDTTQRHEDQTTTSTSSSKTRKLKRSFNDIDNANTDNEDDSLVLPRKKQQHLTNTSKDKTQLIQQQQQQQSTAESGCNIN